MDAKGIILDVDGTLMDSNEAHAEAWSRALLESGYPFPLAAVRKLIGMGGDKLLPTLGGIDEKSELGRRISGRRTELFMRDYVDSLKPLPGARAFLQRLRDEGFRYVVGTSAKREEFEAIVRAGGLDDLLLSATPNPSPAKPAAPVTQEEAGASKPDPDIIEAALRELGVPPESALMVGDTPYDIHAAKMARVKTIAFRCGGWDESGLRGAIAVYRDPAELLERWDTSPLAQRPSEAA